MEWIVLDDGADKVGDLFRDVPGVRYFEAEKKMPVGAKRNWLHAKCNGEVILYMDDDDYYPPERVAHAVETLRANPSVLCVGSSKLLTYFPARKEIWALGPYRDNHATAATMAFRRGLLTRTRYSETAALAEEKLFLKNFSIPLVQLDPSKTIMVVAHAHNTFDKNDLIKDGPNEYVRPVDVKPEELIADPELRAAYTSLIHEELTDYPQGRPDQKPDVQEQYAELKRSRQEAAEKAAAAYGTGVLIEENGKRRQLSTDEVLQTLREQGQAIEALQARVQARDELISTLRSQLATATEDPVPLVSEQPQES
tara:strand:- start:1035 stop:1967 length:933 start_codon:yes stop_codon:yes gene_type:complete